MYNTVLLKDTIGENSGMLEFGNDFFSDTTLKKHDPQEKKKLISDFIRI